MLVRLAISDPRGVGWTLGENEHHPLAVPMFAMADTSVCAICQQDDVDEEWEYRAVPSLPFKLHDILLPDDQHAQESGALPHLQTQPGFIRRNSV